ncbi:hypothetical protein E5D57_000754 [Metarhizium anisopliae]|nr:hypothetical protein E5D57_000754 [Metarhizium anisopliae]
MVPSGRLTGRDETRSTEKERRFGHMTLNAADQESIQPSQPPRLILDAWQETQRVRRWPMFVVTAPRRHGVMAFVPVHLRETLECQARCEAGRDSRLEASRCTRQSLWPCGDLAATHLPDQVARLDVASSQHGGARVHSLFCVCRLQLPLIP